MGMNGKDDGTLTASISLMITEFQSTNSAELAESSSDTDDFWMDNVHWIVLVVVAVMLILMSIFVLYLYRKKMRSEINSANLQKPDDVPSSPSSSIPGAADWNLKLDANEVIPDRVSIKNDEQINISPMSQSQEIE